MRLGLWGGVAWRGVAQDLTILKCDISHQGEGFLMKNYPSASSINTILYKISIVGVPSLLDHKHMTI